MEYILLIKQKLLPYTVLKRNDAVLCRDKVHRDLFHFTDPLSKDCWTINRCGEENQTDRRWQEDQTLLPHLSTRWVVEVVNLVKDDRINSV